MRIGIDCDGVLRDFIPDLINKIKEINPELTIEMSATPILQNPDEIVTVPIETVKLDGMIKKSIILNPGFKNILKNNKIYSNNAKTSDLFILDQAIKKRNEIANEYKKGLKFNLGTFNPTSKDGFSNEFLYGKVVRWYDSL